MGTWGHDSFDNDHACDWAYGLSESEGLDVIEDAIDSVVEAEDYLDASCAEEAIVAADVLARLRGNFGVRNPYTECADKWVSEHPQQPPAFLIQKACKALDRILTPPSEILELWQESETEFPKWEVCMRDLRSRLVH